MAEAEHALHTFMAQVTSEMASEYGRIFARSADDPGTAGDEGEENWATLLREWLPPSYHVATKGRLIAANGEMSPQVDVLVLKPFYPHKLREKKVWLANGVAAAFECKNTLRVEHLAQSAERCRSFKALFPRRTGSPARELRSSLIYGVLAHSHGWKSPGSDPAENVKRALWQAIKQANHPTDLIDIVCLADVGCWSEMAITYYEAAWQPDAKAYLETVFGRRWGPASSMVQATLASENQHQTFQPIGGLLAYLTQRLAWNDPAIRDLADYYRMANLWGQGAGQMRFWPTSIFSAEVLQSIGAGGVTNGGDWSEWDMGIV